ncbi:MAG: SpoIIE family protein phosphatase [Candidatus Riflebacteria bacterium]|nr:SpoIIE family protein phosphatase [Candidatus Riflebacteria bacterium]
MSTSGPGSTIGRERSGGYVVPTQSSDVGTRSFMRRAYMFALIFYGIPMLLAFLGFRQVVFELEASRRGELELRLEETLSTIEAGADTLEFMTRLLQELGKRVYAKPDPAATFRRLAITLKKRFPGIFEFTFVDESGAVVEELSDVTVSHFLLKQFFADYRNYLAGHSTGYGRNKAFIRSFFGSFVPVEGDIHEKLHYASAQSHHRFLFLTRPRAGGMLIVHLNQPKNWDEIALRDRVLSHNRQQSRIHVNKRVPIPVTVVGLNQRLSTVFAPFGLDVIRGKAIWKSFRSSLTSSKWHDSVLWSRRAVFPHLSLLASVPFAEDSDIHRLDRVLFACLVLLWLALAVITHRVMDGRLPLYVSVRAKLIFAFMYTAAVPLIVMGITARTYLTERRQVLESHLHTDVEKSMIAFDSVFPHTFEPMALNVKNAFLRLSPPHGASVSSLIPELNSIQTSFAIDSLRIFDVSGKAVYENIDDAVRSLKNEDFNMFDRIAATIIRNLNSHFAAASAPAPDNKANQASQSDMDWFLSNITKQLGNISTYEFGPGSFLISILPVFDDTQHAIFLAVAAWSRARIERQYLVKRLIGFARQLPDTDLYAWNRRDEALSIPHPFRFDRLIHSFRDRAHSTSHGARDRRVMSGDTLLLTGVRCQELIEYNLVAVSRDVQIRRELNDIAWRFAFTAFIMILISITVGILLARAFLAPIAHLSAGVAALRLRDFEATIPVLDDDELGRLSAAFNGMIEGLADLELARVMQESLFPDKPLSLGDWSVYGTCLSASQVGGDYFDYFPVDERRIIIIIGDVTGHGISAALVAAMAKAILAHPCHETNPAKILTAMHTVIAGVLRRKKLMTCFSAVFDVVTGKAIVSNAGHNYPYLIRDGRPQLIEAVGFPLGIARQREFKSREIDLSPGDTLFFYTDGLIEAVDNSGAPLNYPCFEAALPGLLRKNPVETERAIRAWHASRVRPGPPDDDITMVILQSIPGVQTSASDSSILDSITVPQRLFL